jgi:NCAIR mutase (PurE)-related protein
VVNIDNGFGAAFAATLVNRVGIARVGTARERP